MSDAEQVPDPFTDVSVHGLWPLVLDPDAAAGLRFANLGADQPGDCIASPADLPNVSLSIRTFNFDTELDAWAAAVREFGGNAVVVVPGPRLHNSGLQFALVARLDRDAPGGAATTEDAIPLLRDRERVLRPGGTHPDPASVGAEQRARILGGLSDRHQRTEWAARWKPVMDAMVASGGLKPVQHPHAIRDHLTFEVVGFHNEAGRVEGVPGAFRVLLRAKSADDLEPDLLKEWQDALAARGWEVARPERKSMNASLLDSARLSLKVIDAAAASLIADDAKALWAIRERLGVRKASRSTLLTLSLDPETMKVLRRIAEGFPVASGLVRDPAAQFNPRTGKAGVVAASRVRKAHAMGLIQPLWWRDTPRHISHSSLPVPPLDYVNSVLWGLTATGRAMVEGRLDLAEETQSDEEATALAWSSGSPRPGVRLPSPHDGLVAVVPHLPAPAEGTREAIALAMRGGRGFSEMPSWPKGLAIAGAALACGLLATDGRSLTPVPGRT